MLEGIPLFPEQASTLAPEVDNLYFFILAVTGFFALLVAVLVVIFAIKYRDRTGAKVGAPITGSIPLELGWSIMPFFVSMAIFVWATVVFFHIVRPPDQTLEIYSTGKQWMWRFQHIDGQSEINELHVPLGRPIKVTFTSEDVLHSLYVPAFRVKADAIPGRYSSIWFTPTKTGQYHLFCAEYCGTKHSGMIGEVIVQEPAEFEAWLLTGRAEGSLASAGGKLFQDLACHTCHRPDQTGRGPVLPGLFGRTITLQNGARQVVDEAYLRESILRPAEKVTQGFQPVMPAYQGLITEEGVLQLIEYVKSLGTEPQTQPVRPASGGPAPGETPPLPPKSEVNR